MPTLPTLTITEQAKWDRVFAAFNGSQAEYKEWLREAVRSEVERRELRGVQAGVATQMQTKAKELAGFLDSAT